MSDKNYRIATTIAGLLIMLLALGALLLPLEDKVAGQLTERFVVGWLLIAAGVIELAAVAARRRHAKTAALAALASLLAGIRLAVDPGANLFAVMNVVILWLVVRGAALLYGAARTRPPLGTWIGLAAATDLLLALSLLAGLPIALIVYGLFGQTPQIVAQFAWVFGLSFIATGALWLAIARIGEAPRE